MCWDAGVDVGPMFHQQSDRLDAALPRSDHQWLENVQIWVGASVEQHAHCIDVVVDDTEVEGGAAAVLIQLRPLLRELGIDIKARLNQHLQGVIMAALRRQVQWADSSPPDSGLTGCWDQHGDDSETTSSI